MVGLVMNKPCFVYRKSRFPHCKKASPSPDSLPSDHETMQGCWFLNVFTILRILYAQCSVQSLLLRGIINASPCVSRLFSHITSMPYFVAKVVKHPLVGVMRSPYRGDVIP